MLNFLKRIRQPQLPDWRSDWLYRIIFRKAESSWEFCKRNKDPNYWQYVLIEEWSSAQRAFCGGTLLRLWLHDAQGLRQIPLRSRAEHQRKIHDRIFPFVIISFHIYPDKTRVVYCHREANTAGRGKCYKVVGDDDNAVLVADPLGGFWVS